jgi:fatty acid-binding protein DegV
MPVAIVTDSSACLPGLGSPDVRIVPITVALADLERPDHEIDIDHVYEALRRDEPVKSRPPTALDYLAAIEGGEADGVLVLTPAEEFTPMADTAKLAGSMSARPTVVIDTRTAAAAQGLVVAEAATAAHRGSSLEEVAAVAREASGRAELVASLGSAGPIASSGLLPSDRPIRRRRHGAQLFRLSKGKIVSAGIVDAGEVVDTLVSRWRGGSGHQAARSVVFHAGAEMLAERLRAATSSGEAAVPFSPAMTAHTGAGVVGVAWLRPPGTIG